MEDFKSCCRFCMSPDLNNKSVFGPESIKDAIPQKILSCLCTVVHPDDTLPQMICTQCYDDVKSFYKFQRNAFSTISHWLNYLKRDEDSAKRVYANMVKLFQQKNFFYHDENVDYTDALQEKYIEVTTKAARMISDFSKPTNSNNVVNNLNVNFEVQSPTALSLNLQPIASRSLNANFRVTLGDPKPSTINNQEVSSPPRNVLNIPQLPNISEIEKSTSLSSPENIKKTSPRLRKPCPKYKEVISPQKKVLTISEIEDSTTISSTEDTKKVVPKSRKPCPKSKKFRCKHCNKEFNDIAKGQSHEYKEHIEVQLNQYYGGGKLKLESDYINQIRALSYPNQKKLDQSEGIKTESNSGKRKSTLVFKINTKKQRITKKIDTDENFENISCLPTEIIYSDSKCKFCRTILKDKSTQEFLNHLNKFQCNSSDSVCTFCREDFSDRLHLFDEHKKKCFTSMNFPIEEKCSKCPLFFETSSLSQHLYQVHNVFFKCFICDTAFNQKDDLITHLNQCNFKSIYKKAFTCEVCQCVVFSYKSYQIHMLTNHTNHYINIDLDYELINKSDLKYKADEVLPSYKIHQFINCDSQGGFYCGINNCKKVLSTIFQLEAHINSHIDKIKKVDKRRHKRPSTRNTTFFEFYPDISVCDSYIFEQYTKKEEPKQEVDLEEESKNIFLKYFGMKKIIQSNEGQHTAVQRNEIFQSLNISTESLNIDEDCHFNVQPNSDPNHLNKDPFEDIEQNSDLDPSYKEERSTVKEEINDSNLTGTNNYVDGEYDRFDEYWYTPSDGPDIEIIESNNNSIPDVFTIDSD